MTFTLPDPTNEQDVHLHSALRDVLAWYYHQRKDGVLYGTVTLTLKGADSVEVALQATRRYSSPRK